MKTTYFKASLALVLCLSLSWLGQSQAKRSIQKLPLPAKVIIDNRYGSVKLAPWDKEEVQLRINIKVDAGKLERSEEIMEEIEIEFDTSPMLSLPLPTSEILTAAGGPLGGVF